MQREPAASPQSSASAPPRWRTLVVTVLVSGLAVFGGLSGAGVTQALLTGTAQQPAATLSAGTLTVQVNGAASAALGSKTVRPSSPAAWAFTVSNTGDAPADLAGSIAAPSGPAYAASVRALLAPVANAAACTTALAGTPAPLHGYTFATTGSLAPGQTRWYCLVVSVPAGTSAAGTGAPLTFTLTVDATQSAA